MSISSVKRSPSKSRSKSRSTSNDHNFLAMEDDNNNNAWIKSPSITVEDPTQPRWKDEMNCRKQKKSKKNKPKGFGSFYMRAPGQYSMSELLAEQSHRDCVRTTDHRLDDRAKRELADDDSMKESDWFDRNSINPKVFREQKDTENELKERLEYNKRAKNSL